MARKEQGVTHILVLLAALGLIAFIMISSTASFKDSLFSKLFPKPFSEASGPGIAFVDSSNQPITQTTLPTIKVQLTSPWSATASGTGVKGTSSQSFSISSSGDDLNQDSNNSYGPTSKTVWLGTGQSATNSWTGLRFTNVTIPKGVTITSAKLHVYSPSDQWINMGMSLTADASGNSVPFGEGSSPSTRSRTNASVNHSSNTKWAANTSYDLDEIKTVIQEVVNRADWQSGNALSLILKGNGPVVGRKFVTSFDGDPSNAPKLIVTYDTGSVSVPGPTTAPLTTAGVTIAEDSNFTTHVVTMAPYVSNPTYLDYTFSNTSLGTKTVYSKFTASNGQTQVFSGSIDLVSGATPTSTPMIMPMPTTPPGGSGLVSSAAVWNPVTKYDTCPSYPANVVTAADKIAYIKSVHDSYKVQGPDGKWYPTWHPPVDPKTGCKFGHEHGRDPSQSLIWNQVKQYFAYDANGNGTIDASELSAAGLPFGYVNEALDIYNSGAIMRHESHEGHKVEFANGEIDSAEHFFGTDNNLGLVVPIKGGAKWVDSGARCYHFSKVHQGVNSPDAFSMNLHEVYYFASCKGPTAAYDMQTSNAVLMSFGAPGEFTNWCDPENDRTTPVVTGKNATNQNYPGTRGNGSRLIIQRSCIEKYGLVPPNGPIFSINPYEAWIQTLRVSTAAGKDLISGINFTFDVEDASRYYWPGHTDPNTGQANLGRAMDLCYENFNGRVYRHVLCDSATKNGSIQGIKWDDPRSAFRGIHRGMYFQPPVLTNARGAAVWYSDPFGGNAQTTPFPGSIKQLIPSKNVNYNNLGQTDPRVNDRVEDDGGGTVHAPN